MFKFIKFSFIRKRGMIPHFPTPDGMDSEQYLHYLTHHGLEELGFAGNQEYANRLDYELGIIKRMGYCDYFLIVADYVNYARTHDILVGPGRGSGAGSLVSYCLHIFEVDPIKYGLMFERFLNPERQSMPDLDVDFQDDRRNEVVAYIQQKYGYDNVSCIVTMQTLGAKGSLRDTGRIFEYEERAIETLCDSIGSYDGSLRDCYRNIPNFRSIVDSDPYYLEIVAMASKIDGFPRQPGIHGPGIVINNDPLVKTVPIKKGAGFLIAQYEMTSLEEQGCLKMDILSLRNLTIVKDCLRLVELTGGQKIDPSSIPWEDPHAIKVIASSMTMGLFQLESRGMRRAISLVKPTRFEDIVAIISLYRPGPMDSIDSFAKRKNGQEKIIYLSPLLIPILEGTYGILTYQEQIMEISVVLAGFTRAQADSFRRAISKKNAAKIESLRAQFINGCIGKGVKKEVAEEIYSQIERFANYGFNKCHAVAYAKLACQMAYLKANHRLSFFGAILDYVSTEKDDERFTSILNEMLTLHIHFLPPDINISNPGFFPNGKAIRFPLSAIKSISGQLAYRIVEERELHGPYKDIFDLVSRNKGARLDLTCLIKFIDAGALDGFGYSRGSLRQVAPAAIDYVEMFDFGPNQLSLDFDFPKPSIRKIEGNHLDDLLAERSTLGLIVSDSIFSGQEELLRSRNVHYLNEITHFKYDFKVAGVVEGCHAITTKKGTKMAYLTLFDREARVEFALFDERYNLYFALLKEGNALIIKGHRNPRRDGYIADEVERI